MVALKEGEEPPAFWDALGGMADYPHAPPPAEAEREPTLFQCSNKSGAFKVDEPIHDYSQGARHARATWCRTHAPSRMGAHGCML